MVFALDLIYNSLIRPVINRPSCELTALPRLRKGIPERLFQATPKFFFSVSNMQVTPYSKPRDKDFGLADYITGYFLLFLRATAGTAIARLSHRNSVCPSIVCPSVCHTGGSGKNGAS